MTHPSDPLFSGGVDPVSGRYPGGVPQHSAELGEASTTDVAKDQAGVVANTARDAGKHVVGVAGEQAGQVASEATQQVKELVQQTRVELTGQAATQQKRLASGLRALSRELSTMAHGSEPSGMATELVQQAGERTNAVASWLEDREPGHVVDEVTRFARQRPGAFLAAAAGAGFLIGRLGRGLKAAHDNNSDDNASPGPGDTSNTQTGDSSHQGSAGSPVPPGPTYPPIPAHDPSGYQPAPYQQPPAASNYPPPTPGHQDPQAPGSPPPSPSYPRGPSGRDLAP